MSLVKSCVGKGYIYNKVHSLTPKRALSTKFHHNINKQFISPFIIASIHQNKSQHRFEPHSALWIHHIYQFCSQPMQDNYIQDPLAVKSETEKTNKPKQKYYDTDEIQPSKVNTNVDIAAKPKTKWDKLKQYGFAGGAIYCTFWFGMYGFFWSIIHWKFIDITDLANMIPFAQERVQNALAHSMGELTVALIITEALEVVRLPLVLIITPPIAKYWDKRKK